MRLFLNQRNLLMLKFLKSFFNKEEIHEIKNLKEELEIYKKKQEDFKSSIHNFDLREKELTIKLESQEKQTLSLREQLKNYQEADNHLSKSENEFKTNEAKLLASIKSLTEELNDLKNKLSGFDALVLQNKHLEEQNIQLNSKIEANENQISTLNSQKSSLLKEVLDLNQSLKEIAQKNVDTELKLKTIKSEFISSDKPVYEAPTHHKLIPIKKILIVDDSNIILMQLKNYFKNSSFEVHTATSGSKAIDKLREEEFELVITDVNMPEMNGIELSFYIREFYPQLRVIIMTAFEIEIIKDKAVKNVKILYTDKPLHFDDLLKLINNMSEKPIGFLSSITLFDFIVMLILSKKEECLKIVDKISAKEGKIFFSYGEITHAEFNNLSGLDAFKEIVQVNAEKIEVLEDKYTKKSINLKTEESLQLAGKN